MLSQNVKTLLIIAAIAFQFVISANASFALMEIEHVSKKRAKALGIEVRVKANGSKQVWVELEFKPEGELKKFHHVSLEIREGNELLVGYAPMEAKRPSSTGPIKFLFLANRAYLEKITLRVVEGDVFNMVGHELRLKEFIELNKVP